MESKGILLKCFIIFLFIHLWEISESIPNWSSNTPSSGYLCLGKGSTLFETLKFSYLLDLFIAVI